MTDGASRYEDIIDLPHPEPRSHARMSMGQRAAQFAPFAALTGHAESIQGAVADAQEHGPDSESYSIAEEQP